MAGRPLDERDTLEAPGAVTVNEEMARRYWAGRQAIGGRVRIGDAWCTVVGRREVGQVRGAQRVAEAVHVLVEQPVPSRPTPSSSCRPTAIPSDLLAAVQREVRAVDSRVPVFDVMTLEEHLQMSVFLQRMAAVLLGLFGLLALLLATIGLYGVLALPRGAADQGNRRTPGARRRTAARSCASSCEQGVGRDVRRPWPSASWRRPPGPARWPTQARSGWSRWTRSAYAATAACCSRRPPGVVPCRRGARRGRIRWRRCGTSDHGINAKCTMHNAKSGSASPHVTRARPTEPPGPGSRAARRDRAGSAPSRRAVCRSPGG